MSVEDELLNIARDMDAIQIRFVNSGGELFLKTADQAEFKSLAVQAKALLDTSLGRMNEFSMNLLHAVNSGSGGFFGGPSLAAVGEAAAITRGAVNHIRRQHLVGNATVRPTKQPYVDPSRLHAIRTATSSKWDFARLAQMCGELNVAHENECHMSVAMLVRAVVDHVPPIFGCRNFSDVANNYAGAASFKKSMAHLDKSLRNIADAHLHSQIRRRESIPTGAQVNVFSADLDVLLSEVLRLA